MDGAIFGSGHEAMRYAYSYNAEQYPVSLIARMMKAGAIGSGRGLYGLDGAAIAGSVKRVVESLPHEYRYSLVCRYARSTREYEEAFPKLLRHATASVGTGVHSTRMILMLICRYFGRPDEIKLSALADEFGVDASTMTRRWQSVRNCLREIESRAAVVADNALVDAGLVIALKN